MSRYVVVKLKFTRSVTKFGRQRSRSASKSTPSREKPRLSVGDTGRWGQPSLGSGPRRHSGLSSARADNTLVISWTAAADPITRIDAGDLIAQDLGRTLHPVPGVGDGPGVELSELLERFGRVEQPLGDPLEVADAFPKEAKGVGKLGQLGDQTRRAIGQWH